jgi:hypothetical protein
MPDWNGVTDAEVIEAESDPGERAIGELAREEKRA